MIFHTHTMVRVRRSNRTDRLGVTELSRLTSDPILTADRRGGILISFGRNSTLRRVLNPFEAHVRSARCPHRAEFAFAFHPSSRMYLRASDRFHARIDIRRDHRTRNPMPPVYIRALPSVAGRSSVGVRDPVPLVPTRVDGRVVDGACLRVGSRPEGVAAWATSFAIQSKPGFVYKAVEREALRKTLPW